MASVTSSSATPPAEPDGAPSGRDDSYLRLLRVAVHAADANGAVLVHAGSGEVIAAVGLAGPTEEALARLAASTKVSGTARVICDPTASEAVPPPVRQALAATGCPSAVSLHPIGCAHASAHSPPDGSAMVLAMVDIPPADPRPTGTAAAEWPERVARVDDVLRLAAQRVSPAPSTPRHPSASPDRSASQGTEPQSTASQGTAPIPSTSSPTDSSPTDSSATDSRHKDSGEGNSRHADSGHDNAHSASKAASSTGPSEKVARTEKLARNDLPELFDDAAILCCTLDAEGRLLHFNTELERLSGYRRETLPNTEAFVEALLPDPAERERAVAFLVEAPSEWITLDMHTVNGGSVTTRWTCVVLPGGRRLALGFDDTERDAYEQALREERDRLATLFRNLPTPVVHGVPKDDTFTVHTLNPAFESVFGVSAEDMEGRDLHDIIVPEWDRERAGRINRTVVRDATVQAEVRRIADGQEKDFRVRAALRPGGPNGASEAYAIYTDISDHKAYERKLKHAKERAEEAARLKSAMLANMSHEVRTPLTAIIGFAEILRNALDNENARFAETIRRSSHRLMETLDSVLELSKLDAGAYALRRIDVNVSEHVRETVEMMTPMAENADVHLRASVPEADVHGKLDASAVDRIVTNLISNAIKFTPEHGRVEVGVERVAEEDGAAACIRVSDTGVGIDASFVPHLFDAFRQESDGVGRSYEGAGLGLAITKRLTEMMDGRIRVESQKGEGTTFTVLLPLGSADAQASDAQESDAPASDAPAEGR